MGTRCWLCSVVVQTLVAAAALGQVGPLEDRSAVSEGGVYQVKAALAAGGGADARFRYTLKKADAEGPVWEREQDEGWPLRVHVSDRGWVTALVTPTSLVVLEPEAGKKTLEFDVASRFSEEERREHVNVRTAGVGWVGGSMWCFAAHEEREYFALRTGFGRRVVVDLRGAEVVEQPSEALVARLRAVESRRALDLVRKAARQVKEYPIELGWARLPEGLTPVAEVLGAIRIVAEEQVSEAAPALRRLEQSEYLGDTRGDMINRRFKDGEINPFYRGELVFRMAARYALRRLGEEPADVAVNGFWTMENGAPSDGVPIYRIKGERQDLITELQPGMTPGEILLLIGTPEYVNLRLRAWEYDIDGEDPHTLRLYFNRGAKELARTERVEAAWTNGERAKQIFEVPR